jgi:hypothetical protein
MKQKKDHIRVFVGAAIWIALISVGVTMYRTYWDSDVKSSVEEIVEYSTKPRQEIELQFEYSSEVRVGDPIFMFDDGRPLQIGEIARVESAESLETEAVRTKFAIARLYGNCPELDSNDFFTHHSTPENIGWVVQTMLPKETRKRIGQLISLAYQHHHQEIIAELKPLIRAGLMDAAIVVREDLENALAKRSEQIQKIADRYQVELIDKKLVPLIKAEIWPIVQQRGEPVAREIGEEVWSKVSIWRFGIRMAYDISPLPKKDLTKKEFEKFVEKEIIPILDDYLPDILDVQQEIIVDVLQNEKVKQMLGAVMGDLAQDEELRTLITEVLREVFVDNPRLNQIIRQHWTSPEAQHVMQITQSRLEPTITTIGEELFGNPHEQITPEFNRVLRNRVLLKDLRWLVFHQGKEGQPGKGDDDSIGVTAEAGEDVNKLNVLETGYQSSNPFYQPGRE